MTRALKGNQRHRAGFTGLVVADLVEVEEMIGQVESTDSLISDTYRSAEI